MRTTIALLLGVWLAGTLLLGGVASENFFMIDRLLAHSHASLQKDVAALPAGEARAMLRYVSSELNRFYFQVWGWFELGLAVIVVWLAIPGLKQSRFKVGFSSMLALVAVMTLYITPRIIVVGRALDFVPRYPPPPGLSEFGMLHGAYSILDLVKLLIGVWMAVALARSERGETR